MQTSVRRQGGTLWPAATCGLIFCAGLIQQSHCSVRVHSHDIRANHVGEGTACSLALVPSPTERMGCADNSRHIHRCGSTVRRAEQTVNIFMQSIDLRPMTTRGRVLHKYPVVNAGCSSTGLPLLTVGVGPRIHWEVIPSECEGRRHIQYVHS